MRVETENWLGGSNWIWVTSLLGVLLFPQSVSAQDTLVVDVSSATWPIAKISNGFHGGFWNDLGDGPGCAVPPLLSEIAPRVLHGGFPYDLGSCPSPYNVDAADRTCETSWVDSLGAIRVVQLMMPWCWVAPESADCANPPANCPPHPIVTPDSVAAWGRWADYLEVAIPQIDSLTQLAGIDTVAVTFWAEANLCNWWPCEATSLEFYEFWRATVDSIRSLAPSILIAGPSLANVMLNESDPGWSKHQIETCATVNNCGSEFNYDRPTLRGFLAYCDTLLENQSINAYPDIIDWHSFDSDDSTAVSDPLAEVLQVKAFIEANTDHFPNTDTLLAISESMGCEEYMVPGDVLWHFAQGERAASEGLLWMARAYFADSPPSHCTPSSDTAALQGRHLNGLVHVGDGNDDDYGKPRSLWWMYRDFARLSGEYLDLEFPSGFTGLASVNETDYSARVLAGVSGGDEDSTSTLIVRFENLDEIQHQDDDGIVEVVVHLYTGEADSMWAVAPSEAYVTSSTFSHRYEPVNGVLEIPLTGSVQFQGRGAAAIEISRPIFKTISAAQ